MIPSKRINFSARRKHWYPRETREIQNGQSDTTLLTACKDGPVSTVYVHHRILGVALVSILIRFWTMEKKKSAEKRSRHRRLVYLKFSVCVLL